MILIIKLTSLESIQTKIRLFIFQKFSDAQDSFMISTNVGYLFATHKPQLLDTKWLEENNIKIVCHGHTHKRKFEKIGNILYINPGAISFARDGHELSYLIIKIENFKVEHTFYNL